MKRFTLLLWVVVAFVTSTGEACVFSPRTFSSWRQGFVFVDNDDGSCELISSWDAGFGGFLEVSHRIAPYFEIAPRIAATLVWFDKYKGEQIGANPWQSWSLQPIAPMPRLHLRLTFRARPPDPAYPFVEFASEVMVAYVPEVKWTVRDGFTHRKFTVTAPETGKVEKKAFFGIGTGWVSSPQKGSPQSGFEICFMTSTDNRTQRFELACFLIFK